MGFEHFLREYSYFHAASYSDTTWTVKFADDLLLPTRLHYNIGYQIIHKTDTTWTVEFADDLLLPTHLHYKLVKYKLSRALLPTHLRHGLIHRDLD